MQRKAASEAARQEFQKLQSANDRQTNELQKEIQVLTNTVEQLSSDSNAST